jgi:hypothetical protein
MRLCEAFDSTERHMLTDAVLHHESCASAIDGEEIFKAFPIQLALALVENTSRENPLLERPAALWKWSSQHVEHFLSLGYSCQT